MLEIAREAQRFAAGKQQAVSAARQLVALRLVCGIDMPQALDLSGSARSGTITRVRRMMERERLKGAAGHVDYDLDRHIALSESLMLLEGRSRAVPKRNGARRRRR